jgi:hypothetical protein
LRASRWSSRTSRSATARVMGCPDLSSTNSHSPAGFTSNT